MRRRFVHFSVDVWRFTPLTAVGIAVLVNLINLRNVVDGQLSALDGLERFAIALFLSTLACGGISRLLTSYALKLAESAHDEEGEQPTSETRAAN